MGPLSLYRSLATSANPLEAGDDCASVDSHAGRGRGKTQPLPPPPPPVLLSTPTPPHSQPGFFSSASSSSSSAPPPPSNHAKETVLRSPLRSPSSPPELSLKEPASHPPLTSQTNLLPSSSSSSSTYLIETRRKRLRSTDLKREKGHQKIRRHERTLVGQDTQEGNKNHGLESQQYREQKSSSLCEENREEQGHNNSRRCLSEVDKTTSEIQQQRTTPRQSKFADFGPRLGSGRTGLVYQYNADFKDFVVKIFLNMRSFERERHAYVILRRAKRYDRILVPHYYKEILLPQKLIKQAQSFVDDESDAEAEDSVTDRGLVLEHLRGPTLCDILFSPKTLTSSYLTELHNSTRSTLKTIHQLGIVHNDIKENNLVFQTKHALPQDCFIIDFGHSGFQKHLSVSTWKRRCVLDEEALDNMFRRAEARLAIDLSCGCITSKPLKEHLSQALCQGTELYSDLVEVLREYDNPCREGDYIESLLPDILYQQSSSIVQGSSTLQPSTTAQPPSIVQPSSTIPKRLAMILRFASGESAGAEYLIDTIISLIPNPSPLLAVSLVDILIETGRYNEAISLANTQLSNPSPLPPLFAARFHEQKIQMLVDGLVGLDRHIKAIESAMPSFVEAYGAESSKVKRAEETLGELREELRAYEDD